MKGKIMTDVIHILFTTDEKYALRLPTVIKSIQINNPYANVEFHVVSDDMSDGMKENLLSFCDRIGVTISFYSISDDLFKDAPVNRYYSRTMYYRMLAGDILPKEIDKIIYLDPDILVINPLVDLWNEDLTGYLFAAASHTVEDSITDNINRIRLETSNVYFNTGVLAMNLKECRGKVRIEDINCFIADNEHRLLLPDQDVFNALYGELTKQISDAVWNYDARKYTQYLLISKGIYDEDWIMKNTSILHYCGKDKPWNKNYRYRFGNIYRHYENICRRDMVEGYVPESQ